LIPRKLVSLALRSLPLLLLPIVLAPALVLYLQSGSSSGQYQSNATIWVLDPDQIQRASLDVENAYLTPAQRQASVLRDLLMTESFRLQVAERAGLIGADATGGEPDNAGGLTPGDRSAANIDPAELAAGMTEDQRTIVTRIVGSALAVTASGANLLTVTSTYPDPAVAQALGRGAIAAYDERLRAESERQDRITLEYFDEQLSVAETELIRRRDALNAYIQANANVDLSASGDIQYRSLLGEFQSQDAIVANLNEAIQSTQLSAVSSSQALAARFNVLDEPSLPRLPITPSRMQQFGLPVAALMLGVMLSAAYLLVTYRLDHTIRSTEDLRGIGVPFLGYTPRLSPNGRRWLPRVLRRREGAHARHAAASFAFRKANS